MPNLFTQIITPIVPLTACLQAGGSPRQLDEAESMIAAGRQSYAVEPDAARKAEAFRAFDWLEDRIRGSRAQMMALQNAS